MAVVYSDLHRLFLQSVQSRSILTMKSAVDRLKEIAYLQGFRQQVTEVGVTETIEEINVKIGPFGMEIKNVLAERDGEKFIVLVNTVDDSCIMDRIDHKYTTKEREVFRVLLEAIVLSGTYGSISSTDALHLTVPNVSLSTGAMQELLDRLIADRWFLLTESGRIVPAPRCIAEFEHYFKANFHNNVQECPLCSNVVFYGVICPHCDVITHKHCFLLFNNERPGENVCPKPACKKLISNINGMDHDDDDEDDEDNEEPPTQRRSGSRRQRRNVSPETPENTPAAREGDDFLMEVDDEPTPGPSRGRRKRRIE